MPARRQSSRACFEDLLESSRIERRETDIWIFDRALQLLAYVTLYRLAPLQFEAMKRLEHQLWWHLTGSHVERAVS